MFLFFLVWSVVLSNEASKVFPYNVSTIQSNDTNSSFQNPPKLKRKRNLPGNPDPNSEVIALSPETLLATNRFVCEICQKGFQREQNLQLHRRGHNLPWKLKQRSSVEIRKRVYVCPEPTCVHHHPSRALGDLTGIKKHFSRKHGEKKWKCDKCSKIYAVQSDWKAHSKTCGTREYRCDCGTIFSRKDSFVTHRAFCEALAQESARISANTLTNNAPPPPPPHHPFRPNHQTLHPLFSFPPPPHHHQHLFFPTPNPLWDPHSPNPNPMWDDLPATNPNIPLHIKTEALPAYDFPLPPHPHLSATALLQKAASFGSHPVSQVGSSMAGTVISPHFMGRFGQGELAMWRKEDHTTRDFLGLTRENSVCGNNPCVDANVGLKELLTYTDVSQGGAGFGFASNPTWKQ